jgi:hypothetical protein
MSAEFKYRIKNSLIVSYRTIRLEIKETGSLHEITLLIKTGEHEKILEEERKILNYFFDCLSQYVKL